jgi:hypothetical protein
MDHFTVTLPSNSSMKYYTNNTTAHFITQLRETISLHGDWEVGLVEIHYPQTFFNVSKGDNYIKILFTISGEERKSEVPMTLFVPPGYYRDEQELVAAVNLVLHPYQVGEFAFESMSRQSYFTPYKPDPLSDQPKVSIQYMMFSPNLSRQFGYEPATNIAEEIVSPSSMNLVWGTPKHIYVYCDLITPQLVGDTAAPLLRIINTQSTKYNFGEETTSRLTPPQYLPLLKREFSTIEIDLRESTGLPVPFKSGTSAVVLQFRRRTPTS